MKKQLLFCLALCLLFLFVGCRSQKKVDSDNPAPDTASTDYSTTETETPSTTEAEAPSTTETETPNPTETEAPSPTETEPPVAIQSPYYDVLRDLKEKDTEEEGEGILYDLDNDGTDELIVMYKTDISGPELEQPLPFFVCDVYTLRDGNVLTLLDKSPVRYYYGVAGDWGEVYVLRMEDRIYLGIECAAGDIQIYDSQWQLYALKDGQLSPEKQASYSRIQYKENEDYRYEESYTIDGQEVDAATHEAWLASMEILASMNGLNDDQRFASLIGDPAS